MPRIKCFRGKGDVIALILFLIAGIALYDLFRHLYLDILIMAAVGLVAGLITSDIKK
jgi:hypothetical protein